MSALCLAAGALFAAIPVSHFTLAVTDTVDNTRSEVVWRIVGKRLVAGSEERAASEGDLALSRQLTTVVPRLLLSHASGAPVHELCIQKRCRPVAELLPGLASAAVIEIFPCPEP